MGAIVIDIRESKRFAGMNLAKGVIETAARRLKALGYAVDIHDEPPETVAPVIPKKRKRKNAKATRNNG